MRLIHKAMAATIGLFFLASLSPLRAEESGICSEPVRTAQGLIQGRAVPGHAACAWKGIPYAAAPVGELRLRAPQPARPQAGIFEAFEYGAACPQDETITSGGEAKRYDEDCLTLNIWRPRKPGKFPVMYWIHGGAFRQGSGTYEMSSGARLAAERDVVVVTIDYRIGALGFLALPELAQEDEHQSAGNYGILDQVQGLRWVQDNIAGFGGDPDNVTIFGQSAGGMSVCVLLASPLAKGLFHQAIPMSGSCDSAQTLDKGYEQGRELLKLFGCEGQEPITCIRKLPAEVFVGKGKNTVVNMLRGGSSSSPHLDGYALADQPLALIRQGNYNRVPVMVGHTRDEIKLFTMLFPGMSLWPRFLVNKLLRFLLGPLTDQVLTLYSYSDYQHPVQLLLTVSNDAFISRGFLTAEALAGQSPVYYYRFDWDETRFAAKMGAFHGLDEPLVFGALEMDSRLAKLLANKKAIQSGRPLSEQMMSYYTNFAKTGDPNGPGLPAWPAYTLEKKERLYLDNPITLAPLADPELARYRFFGQYTMEDMLLNKGKEPK